MEILSSTLDQGEVLRLGVARVNFFFIQLIVLEELETKLKPSIVPVSTGATRIYRRRSCPQDVSRIEKYLETLFQICFPITAQITIHKK